MLCASTHWNAIPLHILTHACGQPVRADNSYIFLFIFPFFLLVCPLSHVTLSLPLFLFLPSSFTLALTLSLTLQVEEFKESQPIWSQMGSTFKAHCDTNVQKILQWLNLQNEICTSGKKKQQQDFSAKELQVKNWHQGNQWERMLADTAPIPIAYMYMYIRQKQKNTSMTTMLNPIMDDQSRSSIAMATRTHKVCCNITFHKATNTFLLLCTCQTKHDSWPGINMLKPSLAFWQILAHPLFSTAGCSNIHTNGSHSYHHQNKQTCATGQRFLHRCTNTLVLTNYREVCLLASEGGLAMHAHMHNTHTHTPAHTSSHIASC